MIPFIRSLAELMAITESRLTPEILSTNDNSNKSTGDNGLNKRYLKSRAKKEIDLPVITKNIRRKRIQNKESILRFFDELDYNNQIQSSYDLKLIELQNKRNLKDVA